MTHSSVLGKAKENHRGIAFSLFVGVIMCIITQNVVIGGASAVFGTGLVLMTPKGN